MPKWLRINFWCGRGIFGSLRREFTRIFFWATGRLTRSWPSCAQEMDRIGQEFYLPALHPREIWEASGRWALMGDNLFRLKDRKGADMCLGMTEEEVMTEIARKELRSYKQLPQIWYQIAPKFRDEPRPKAGLLRVRQFMMKDAYSFDIDAAGLDVSYKKHYETYCRIFDRCGLKYMVVEADSGAMGGKESHEFMVRTPAGEDQIVSCDGCNYAANMEKATSRLEAVADLVPEGDGKPLEVHTPGQKTIEEVAKFLGDIDRITRSRRWHYGDENRRRGQEEISGDRGAYAGRPSVE